MDIFKQIFDAIRLDLFAALFAAGGLTAFGAYRLFMALVKLSEKRHTTIDKAVASLAGIAERDTDLGDLTRDISETLPVKIAQAMQPAMSRLDRIEENLELITAMLTRMDAIDDCLRVETSSILNEVRNVKDQMTPILESLETGEYAALTWETLDVSDVVATTVISHDH